MAQRHRGRSGKVFLCWEMEGRDGRGGSNFLHGDSNGATGGQRRGGWVVVREVLVRVRILGDPRGCGIRLPYIRTCTYCGKSFFWGGGTSFSSFQTFFTCPLTIVCPHF